MFRGLADASKDSRFAGLLAIAGLVAGIALWTLTAVLSRMNLSGNGWCLSGNRALILPFDLGPAAVAGGWAGIILRMRGHPRWLQLGVGSGLIGLVLVAGSLLSLVVLGPGGRAAGATASLFFGFLLYGWLVASAITAAMIPAPDPDRARPPFLSIAAILPLPITLIGGCPAGAAALPS